jgi:hypothetical protein
VFDCRREPLALALTLGLLVAGAAPTAAATPPPARVFLDYSRDPRAASCVSREQLVEAVEARLGRRVFVSEAEADLVVEVRARREGGRFAFDVRLVERDHQALGQRQLSTAARHCSALDDSLALVVSLAADVPTPDRAGASVDPAAAPSDGGPSAPRPLPPLETPLAIPAATHAPRLGLRVEPSLGLAVLAGPLPGAVMGLELGVTLRVGQFWPVSIRGSGWLPYTHQLGPDRGARFTARTLALGICPWEEQLGELVLQACVLEWLGRVDARGFGFDEDQQTERWLSALGGGATLGHWLGPVFAAASFELLAPLVRRRYFFANVTDDTTLHEEPWVYGALAVRVGTEF